MSYPVPNWSSVGARARLPGEPQARQEVTAAPQLPVGLQHLTPIPRARGGATRGLVKMHHQGAPSHAGFPAGCSRNGTRFLWGGRYIHHNGIQPLPQLAVEEPCSGCGHNTAPPRPHLPRGSEPKPKSGSRVPAGWGHLESPGIPQGGSSGRWWKPQPWDVHSAGPRLGGDLAGPSLKDSSLALLHNRLDSTTSDPGPEGSVRVCLALPTCHTSLAIHNKHKPGSQRRWGDRVTC